MSEIAQALQRVAHQDHEALDRAFADSYPDLKRIAHARLYREQFGVVEPAAGGPTVFPVFTGRGFGVAGTF